MVTKRQLLQELSLRIARCEANGDWRGREIYTATWHRVNEEADLSVSGLARRMAAEVAATPLDERVTRTIPIERVGGGPEPGDSPGEWTDAAIAAHRKENAAGFRPRGGEAR